MSTEVAKEEKTVVEVVSPTPTAIVEEKLVTVESKGAEASAVVVLEEEKKVEVAKVEVAKVEVATVEVAKAEMSTSSGSGSGTAEAAEVEAKSAMKAMVEVPPTDAVPVVGSTNKDFDDLQDVIAGVDSNEDDENLAGAGNVDDDDDDDDDDLDLDDLTNFLERASSKK